MFRTLVAVSVLLCIGTLPLSAQSFKKVAGKPQPTEFMESPWLVGAETVKHWQELPNQVNAPDYRTRVYPGQHLTVAVGARGDNRDPFLRGQIYTISITAGSESKVFERLQPAQVRRVKAQGADFVLSALRASGAGSGEAESLMSMVSFAFFDLDWVPPANAKDGTIKVMVKATSQDSTSHQLENSKIEFWTYERAVKEGGFKDNKEHEDWMMGYYQRPEPTRLLHHFRASKDDQNAFKPNTRLFCAEVLKSNPEAAHDLLSRLKEEDPVVRIIGVVAFLDAGYSLTGLLEALPADDRERFKMIPEKIPALPDPYDLAPDTQNVIKVPSAFDMLWSQFLATGDPKPVRAIANGLEWRKEGKDFLALKKSGKKPDGITVELAKGVSYMAAGWSLGSFYRNHPLVTDYIEAWKKDPAVPLAVREELGALLTNEAFKRD
ncbi:MAG: hypothetical protein HY014_09530 [Acidobacteria bacterium]|nr:hypothetical protein [Acidobacteriota bacterium]MBI3488395.1 hypothetical protein [Acidobacteriota bacterium]